MQQNFSNTVFLPFHSVHVLNILRKRMNESLKELRRCLLNSPGYTGSVKYRGATLQQTAYCINIVGKRYIEGANITKIVIAYTQAATNFFLT